MRRALPSDGVRTESSWSNEMQGASGQVNRTDVEVIDVTRSWGVVDISFLRMITRWLFRFRQVDVTTPVGRRVPDLL